MTPRDVRDLLELYGVHDSDYRDALMALARLSRQRTWWTDYRDLMRPGNFVGMEADASSTRVWEPIVLPGLLQTEGYMRALMRTVEVNLAQRLKTPALPESFHRPFSCK